MVETKTMTIYDALLKIKNKEIVMPAFQRQFVWNLTAIEKLWDSILLDYPISHFLFWELNEENITQDTEFCMFLEDVTFKNSKEPITKNYVLTKINLNQTHIAILDGQQRLTSLYLSLFGDVKINMKYARKDSGPYNLSELVLELNRNKIIDDDNEFNTKKYGINFTIKVGRLSSTQIKVKDILNTEFINKQTRIEKIKEKVRDVPPDSKQYAIDLLSKLCSKIYDEKLIVYTDITNMNQDNALEMFIRFNNGGKALKKSDITMSILETYWPEAKIEFGKLLVDEFEEFGTDFLIRSALMIYGDVVKSTITRPVVDELRNNWGLFKSSLSNLNNVLKELKIDIKRFSTCWNVLLPILYSIYYNPNYHDDILDMKSFLIRAIIFIYFRSGTTGKLQEMKKFINEFEKEFKIEMLDQIPDLRVTDARIDDVLNFDKGSRVAEEVLYYLSLDWRNDSYNYEQDHLHPEIAFNYSCPFRVDASTWATWRSMRNRLPNLQLLEGVFNESKSNKRLIDYYSSMTSEEKEKFRKRALIPDTSLDIENFGTFFELRKKLMANEIKKLIQ